MKVLLKVGTKDRKDTRGLKMRLEGPTEDRKGWAEKTTKDWQAD